jgi:hypothetical protein
MTFNKVIFSGGNFRGSAWYSFISLYWLDKCILGSLMMSTYIEMCSLEGGEAFQCKEQLLKV